MVHTGGSVVTLLSVAMAIPVCSPPCILPTLCSLEAAHLQELQCLFMQSLTQCDFKTTVWPYIFFLVSESRYLWGRREYCKSYEPESLLPGTFCSHLQDMCKLSKKQCHSVFIKSYAHCAQVVMIDLL